jgi:RHS repeat-associated protein
LKKTIIALLLALLIVSLPVCFADTLNLIYDANGNLVTGDGFYREYNSLNQLVKIRLLNSTGNVQETYVYDPVEEKVLLKNVSYTNGTWKETVYYWFDEYIEVYNGTWSNYTYVEHEGMRVAELRGNNKYFVLADHLGSSTVVTNASGNVTERSAYTPFGEQINSTLQSRYSYTGQEYDSVIGDYDYHARRYRADWGKLTTPDTILQHAYNPQGLNRYSYVKNNPWNRIDPSGHFEELALLILFLGTILTAQYGLAKWQEKIDEAHEAGDEDAELQARVGMIGTAGLSAGGFVAGTTPNPTTLTRIVEGADTTSTYADALSMIIELRELNRKEQEEKDLLTLKKWILDVNIDQSLNSQQITKLATSIASNYKGSAEAGDGSALDIAATAFCRAHDCSYGQPQKDTAPTNPPDSTKQIN